jgi:hypothetical protein
MPPPSPAMAMTSLRPSLPPRSSSQHESARPSGTGASMELTGTGKTGRPHPHGRPEPRRSSPVRPVATADRRGPRDPHGLSGSAPTRGRHSSPARPSRRASPGSRVRRVRPIAAGKTGDHPRSASATTCRPSSRRPPARQIEAKRNRVARRLRRASAMTQHKPQSRPVLGWRCATRKPSPRGQSRSTRRTRHARSARGLGRRGERGADVWRSVRETRHPRSTAAGRLSGHGGR